MTFIGSQIVVLLNQDKLVLEVIIIITILNRSHLGLPEDDFRFFETSRILSNSKQASASQQ